MPAVRVIRLHGDDLKVNYYYYFIGFTTDVAAAAAAAAQWVSLEKEEGPPTQRRLLRFIHHIGNAHHVRARTTSLKREQLLFTDDMSTYCWRSCPYDGNFFNVKPHV